MNYDTRKTDLDLACKMFSAALQASEKREKPITASKGKTLIAVYRSRSAGYQYQTVNK